MLDAWRKTWDWKAECEALIRIVDPHSAARPVYLFDAGEARELVDMRRLCSTGLTSIALSARFRPLLQRRGEWKGDGFAVVIDVDRLTSPQHIDAVVLHEYAHDLQERHVERRFRRGDGDDATAAVLLYLANPSNPLPPLGWTADEPGSSWRPWHHHTGDFIRLCAHVAYRAQQRVRWMGDAWEVYGVEDARFLSHVRQYVRRLGDEPERLADSPLAELHDIDPPEPFARFAAEDLQDAERRFQVRRNNSHHSSAESTETRIETATEPVTVRGDSYALLLR